MRRGALARVTLASGLSIGGAVLWASITLAPGSHDFGQVIVNESAGHTFRLTGTGPLSSRGYLSPTVRGRDAADFVIDGSGVGPTGSLPSPSSGVQQSTCIGNLLWAQQGSCDYRVIFKPQTPGRKSAQLFVWEYGGETATATLTGEGLFGCRPYLVSCNYVHFYSGTLTVHTVQSVTGTGTNRKGHWETSIDIRIEKGVASCYGVLNDWEEEYTGSRLDRKSTMQGVISGPGLFAIEFQRSRGRTEYTLKFACPSASITTNSIDHLSGETSTGKIPSEPAEWRDASLGADPQPATQIGMGTLKGSQSDPLDDLGAGGVTGVSTMTWLLTRWQ